MSSADVEHLGIRCSLPLRQRNTSKATFMVLFSDQPLVRDFPSAEVLEFHVSFQTQGKHIVFVENLLLQPCVLLPATLSRLSWRYSAQPLLMPVTPPSSATQLLQYFSSYHPNSCPIHLPCVLLPLDLLPKSASLPLSYPMPGSLFSFTHSLCRLNSRLQVSAFLVSPHKALCPSPSLF